MPLKQDLSNKDVNEIRNVYTVFALYLYNGRYKVLTLFNTMRKIY